MLKAWAERQDWDRVSTSDAFVKLKEMRTPAEIISPRLVNGTKIAINVMNIPDIKVPHQSVLLLFVRAKMAGKSPS